MPKRGGDGMAKSRFRLPLRRLDRVLLVAALLLCAGLLLLPAQEGPRSEERR